MGKRSRSMALGALLLISCAAWASATNYTVGDSNGWKLSFDYSTWTNGKSFVVGDNLVFNYVAVQHNVDEVSASDYNSCSSSSPISTENDGSTTITLSTAGKHYFICGITGHCSSGMKLEVSVAAAGGSTPSPSSSPPPPPPPSSSTTPSTPSSAAASLSPAHAIAALLVGLLGMKVALF